MHQPNVYVGHAFEDYFANKIFSYPKFHTQKPGASSPKHDI